MSRLLDRWSPRPGRGARPAASWLSTDVPLVYVDTSVWLQSIMGQEPHDRSDRVLLAGGAGHIQVEGYPDDGSK